MVARGKKQEASSRRRSGTQGEKDEWLRELRSRAARTTNSTNSPLTPTSSPPVHPINPNRLLGALILLALDVLLECLRACEVLVELGLDQLLGPLVLLICASVRTCRHIRSTIERTFEREHKVVQRVGVELVGLLIVLLLVLLYRALHDLNRPLASMSATERVPMLYIGTHV